MSQRPRRRVYTQQADLAARYANGVIWDVLRALGRGTVAVDFQGQTFILDGNPYWPWPHEHVPELIPLDSRGVPMVANTMTTLFILPLDSGVNPGHIYRSRDSAHVGHLSELRPHLPRRTS